MLILHHGLLCGANDYLSPYVWCSSAKGFVQVTSLSFHHIVFIKLIDKKLLSELLELGQARYQYETKQRETISGEWSKKAERMRTILCWLSGWMPEAFSPSSLTFHVEVQHNLGKSHPGSHVICTVQIVSLMVCFHVYSCLHSELKRKKTHWLSY